MFIHEKLILHGIRTMGWQLLFFGWGEGVGPRSIPILQQLPMWALKICTFIS